MGSEATLKTHESLIRILNIYVEHEVIFKFLIRGDIRGHQLATGVTSGNRKVITSDTQKVVNHASWAAEGW